MMPVKFAPVQYDMVQLKGGLDQITPTLSLAPGVIRDGQNFEVDTTGGYARVAGYERYDGTTSPSNASAGAYAVTGNTMPAIGSLVSGQTSGATAVLIAQGASHMVFTKQVGSFQSGEPLRVSGVTVAVCVSPTGATSPRENAEWTALAADAYRSGIGAVPGSGPVRGVFVLNDIVHAFRDNTLGTGCDLYKSSISGWVKINYLYEVTFSAGSNLPADGATLTQGGKTATIKRVMTQSGAWSGTAAGRFIITMPSGGNFAAGAATATGGCTVTIAGIQSAIVMLTGGRFETVQGNFFGSATGQRIYGCDGVNRGFEFDGETLAPIVTGTNPDTPRRVAILKNHLFWGIKSSLVHSGIGEPYTYTALSGAGEISVGEDINVLLVQPGAQQTGTMAVFTASNTFMLYGTSSVDWNLATYNNGTGARPYSGQNASQSYVLDDRGVVSLQTSLNFGNFDQATLTISMRPFIVEKRSKISCSCLNREKSQYRLFFNDGYGLYLTVVNGQYLGGIPVFFPVAMNVIHESEMSSGDEVIFAGGATGYVYQMERGTSFDGSAISAFFTLNYNAKGNSRVLKRYRKASAEVQGGSFASFDFGYSLGYGAQAYDDQVSRSYDSNFTTSGWDSGVTWDSGIAWDGRTIMPSEINLTGTAENIAVTIASSNNYSGQFTINSLAIHYTPRRGLR